MSKIGFIVGHPTHTDQRSVEQRLLGERTDRHAMCMTPGGCRHTGMHSRARRDR